LLITLPVKSVLVAVLTYTDLTCVMFPRIHYHHEEGVNAAYVDLLYETAIFSPFARAIGSVSQLPRIWLTLAHSS